MNTRSIAAAAATGVAALLAPIATAEAGPPGTWTQVTSPGSDIGNTMRVGLGRTADGVLHVAWKRDEASGNGTVLHSAISADAKSVSGESTIFANPGGGVTSGVALVPVPGGGLRAFFGATNSFDNALGTAVSGDGTSWSGHAVASRGGNDHKAVYAASGIGAAVGLDGTWYSIWDDSAPDAAGLHVGLDPNAPDTSLPDGLQSDPGFGVDAVSGQVVAAWNQVGSTGVSFMPVGGGATTIPGSVGQVQNGAAITGRVGAPGVFVAYTQGSNPFLAKPAMYRVDTGKAKRLSNHEGEDIAIAAAPGGRLWVMWKEEGGTIHATRSNPSVTAWGKVVSIKAPKAGTIYDVQGEATNGALDVLALVDTGSIASWHQRLQPGLTLTKAAVKNGKAVLKVTDAGAPVGGAKVKVKGAGSKTTSGAGTVSFDLAEGKHLANASKKGYAGVALSFKAK